MIKTICSGCGLYSLVYIDDVLQKTCLFAQEGENGIAIVMLPEVSLQEGKTVYEVVTGNVRIEHMKVTDSEKV